MDIVERMQNTLDRATQDFDGRDEMMRDAIDEIKSLRTENAELLDENSDLRYEPWPEWARAVLKVVRSHTGYDGYDDAVDGVDMPSELQEHLAEMENEIQKLRSQLERMEKTK